MTDVPTHSANWPADKLRFWANRLVAIWVRTEMTFKLWARIIVPCHRLIVCALQPAIRNLFT